MIEDPHKTDGRTPIPTFSTTCSTVRIIVPVAWRVRTMTATVRAMTIRQPGHEQWLQEEFRLRVPQDPPRGAIVAMCTLVDAVTKATIGFEGE